MIKRLSGQEVFIIIAAGVALLFMYMTLIMTDSGPITTYDTYEEDDVYQIEQHLITIEKTDIQLDEQLEDEDQYLAYSPSDHVIVREQRSGE